MNKEQFLSISLPFKLMCEVTDLGKKRISELNAVYSNGTCVFHYLVESDKGFSEIKPILYPLSDYELLNLDITDEITITNIINKRDIIGNIRWSLMQRLIEEHFDTEGLIEKGEAIDVKTLEINPYI